MSHHPGWAAWQDQDSLPLAKDALGFITMFPRKDGIPIRMTFSPGSEQIACAGLSAFTWLGAAVWSMRQFRRTRTCSPSSGDTGLLRHTA